MTDITIDLSISEGFVVSPSERSSDWVAAFLSYNHLLAALGTADERSLGYMLLTSPTDLYSRLSATYDVGWYINSGETDSDDAIVYNNETPDKYNANNPTNAKTEHQRVLGLNFGLLLTTYHMVVTALSQVRQIT